MNSTTELKRGASVLEIQDKELMQYEWDFLIPPKSRMQENIASVSHNGFSFTELKFDAGFLSDVDHHWGVSFYTNQINFYISLPARTSACAFSISKSKIQLISKDVEQSTHNLEFKKDEYSHPAPNLIWMASWANTSGAWTESVDTVRVILCLGKETAGKCKKNLDIKHGAIWMDKSSKKLGAAAFFGSSILSDIKIVCRDKEFPAHKFLLACKSPVFSSMFQYKLKETEEGRIVMDDVDGNVMEELLRYLYTGTMYNLKDHCQQLLIIAEKYDLMKLKKKCEAVLIEEVTIENALAMYSFAETHRAQSLMAKSVEELKRNKRQIICDEETFKKFVEGYPELMFQLFKI